MARWTMLLFAVNLLFISKNGFSIDPGEETGAAFAGQSIRFFIQRKDSQLNSINSLLNSKKAGLYSPIFNRTQGTSTDEPKKNNLRNSTELAAEQESNDNQPNQLQLNPSLAILNPEKLSVNDSVLPRFAKDSKFSLKWRAFNTTDNQKYIGTYIYDTKEVCGFSIVSNNLPSGESLLLGHYPEGLESFALGSEVPEENFFSFDSNRLLIDFMLSQSKLRPSLIKQVKDCYYAKEEKLTAAKEYIISSRSASFRVWVSAHEILNWERFFFEASIETFEKNIFDQVKKIYDVPTDESGHLTNKRFETATNSYARAYEPSGVFHYLDADPRFRETSAFVHANLALDYYLGIGFVDNQKSSIILNLNVVVNGSLNNAIYQPSETTDSGHPTISIANGDGVILANLATDIDVVTHELGHHVIFQTLKSTSGESLILHEGLSDFFAFAQTSDPCLGESICPESSYRCWMEAQCLRSADNDIHYGSGQYAILPAHQKGQVVSGLLWDLHKQFGVSLHEISLTAMKALSFLNPSSDIQDFITAYALADQFIRGGRDLCALREIAIARGFEDQFSDSDCKVLSTWPQINGQKDAKITTIYGSSADGSLPKSARESTSRRKAVGFCSFNEASEMSYFSFIILVIPLLTGLLRRCGHKKSL